MSRSLGEPNCDAVLLFQVIWNEKIESLLANASSSNIHSNRDTEFFKNEIEKILRTSPYRERLNLRHDVKNNAKAAEIRNKGNQMFHPRVKRYIEAIKYYNESITYAEKGSEQRALAYGNRSIICLELHLYKDCLENIRLARESNYPKRLAEKLKNREQNAKQALRKATKNKKLNEDPPGHVNELAELKLSYPSHKNMPQVANCLQLQRNEQYGRHVVTKCQLNPGDVVMIDKPFASALDDRLRYVRCAYCYQEKTFTLIPCEGCTVAMYCSEECLSKAHQKYHRYECAVIPDMWRIFNDTSMIALRTVALAIAAFDHDLEALKEHLDGLDESVVNAFTVDWNVATQKEIYDVVHVLTTNQQHRSHKELAFIVFVASILHQLVMERTELGSICEVDVKMKTLLFDLILRHLQIGQCNEKQLHFMQLNLNKGIFDYSTYAVGCYPLISMLNHSCASNTRIITLRDGRSAALVVRPIAKKGQLFMDYGPHHTRHHLQKRKNLIQNLYYFQCRCEACQNNYPTILEITGEDILEEDFKRNVTLSNDLALHDAKMVLKWVPVLKASIMKNDRRYPNLQVCLHQEQLEHGFDILYSYTSKLSSYLKYCKP